ncbi:MAG: response regulator transcription factor [Flavobacteriales bacterium]
MELRFSIGLEEPLLANGIKQVITKKPGYFLNELCFNFTDLLIDIQSHRSNFVILDPDLKSFNPSSDLEQIKLLNPNVKVALVCKNAGKAIYHNLLEKGYDGMILSCCSEDEIIKAIDKIMNGQQFICSSITKFKEKQEKSLSALNISEREVEVIKEICYGYSSKEISERLSLSYHTIVTHRKNIFKKFEVKSALELVRTINEMGLYLYDS